MAEASQLAARWEAEGQPKSSGCRQQAKGTLGQETSPLHALRLAIRAAPKTPEPLTAFLAIRG